MNRCLGWAALMGVGMLLGAASSSYQKTNAAADVPILLAEDANADATAELKEIKTQLKEINAYLRSGVVKVVVVMNPNKDN